MYKGELGTANAHKILLKDIGKLFLPEAPVPHCLIEVQWGLTNNGKEGVSFPIVFKNIYALTMGNLNNTSWSPHFRDVTTTGFKATVEGTGYSYHGYWIALGN